MRTRLLEGLRVLDLSQGAAGAFAGRFLALLGARVTAVRLPGPHLAPPTLRTFLDLHKSRRRLDPERRSDRAVLDALAHRSDAIVLDLPRERSRRWGLAPEQLARAPLHPVVVEVTGLYGALPWADQPLAEVVWQAAGGWAALSGVESAPARIRGYPASCLAGAHVALVVAALAFRRLVTGRGGQASVSTVESVAAALEGALSDHFASGGDRANGAAETSRRHAAGPVPGRDGTLLLYVPTDEQRQDLLHLLGVTDTATPTALPGDRVDRTDTSPLLRRLLRDWTRDAWFHTTQAWRLPCSVFLETGEVLRDPHLAARGFFRARGGRPGLGSPWRVTSRRGRAVASAAGRAGDSLGDLPLQGVRVVDLTAMWAGPYATRLLLDLGATIWKVEGPRRPDGIRGRGAAAAPFFHELNRQKFSVALDLKTEAGRADLLRLVARADLVIENFSPRVMRNLGLASAIRRVNRDVVTVSMPAFGRSGPYRDYVGYGATLEALAGLVVQGRAGDEPRVPAVAVSDALSGVLGAAVSVAALYRRAAGHGGADVELPQWEALLQAIGDELLDAARTTLRPPPAPRASRRGAVARGPLAGIFACEHGRSWVAIACSTPQQTRLLDRITAADETSFGAAGCLTSRRRGSGAARLDAWLARHSAEAAAARLAAAGIPAAPVRDVAAICADPLLEARGFWVTVEDETGRRFRVPGPPWRIAGAPPRRETNGARPLGADTARVLSERDEGR